MKASAWIARHRRSLWFLLLVATSVGIWSALGLPASLFPVVDFPRVAVTVDAGDQPADQMEVLVTRQVEEAIRRVPGVTSLRSTTSRGTAEISVSFDWGTDMTAAALEVNAATARAIPQLPPGTQLSTRRMDPTVFPVIAYSLTSATVTPTELRRLADTRIAPLLFGIPGVSRAEATGGALAEFEVEADPDRLLAHDLDLDDLGKALAAANVVSAAGKLEDRYRLLLVVANTPLRSVADIEQVVVARSPSAVVRIADVARVRAATAPQWIRVTADGRDAVLLSIYQQPGGNTVQIAHDVKARLDALRGRLPEGISMAPWYDQSELVLASAASVREAILIGAVLAAGVLLVFLRNLKVTLIAVAVVPAVLAVTVLVLALEHMSFNVMTLGGMAAAVGLIIDDAIVMTEHIVRRLRERRTTARQTVAGAADEFMRPLAGSSAATLVIFAPLAFLTGVTGAFFKALSLTMASSLFISFLVTAAAVPLLAGSLLGEDDARQPEAGRWSAAFKAGYARVMRRVLRRPAWVLAGVLPLVALGGLAFTRVGSGFMPAIDEGGFVLDYRSAPGTALSETDRLLRQVEAILGSTPDVQTYSRRTGAGLGGGLSEPNTGDFFIRLKPVGERRAVEDVMEDVRRRVQAGVPGLSVEMAQLMEDLIGDLTAVPQPVEIKLFADSAARLEVLARSTARALSRVPGVVDVNDGINPAGDALEIHVDRERAAREGLDAAAITRVATAALSGDVVTEVVSAARVTGVRVHVGPGRLRTPEDLGRLLIRAPDGRAVPLARVARFESVSGQPEIGRENLKRMVAVTARISGRDLGSVMGDVKALMARALPPGADYELGGLYEQQQLAFRGLLQVFAAAAALVFVLLLFLYRSLAKALAIVAASLLSVSAVFIGLWVTGVDLNITAMMGMTMIIGIVTEVGIFYFSELEEVAGQVAHELALVRAGQNRMRPIAMTTIAAILTLLPLAFALGQGSEMQQPLAIAIISGLLVQLPLVLVAMPAFYVALHRQRARWLDDDRPEDR